VRYEKIASVSEFMNGNVYI